MNKSKEYLLNDYKPKPFIGYEGIGSSIEISKKGSLVIVKQSFESQLLVTLGLLVMGPLLSLLLAFHWDEIQKKPLFILLTLFFFITLGWIYFFKYLIRLLGERRIMLRNSDRTIHFYKYRNKLHKVLRCDEINEVFIQESSYHTEGRVLPNYTLVLKDKTGRTWDVATSDQREQIANLLSNDFFHGE